MNSIGDDVVDLGAEGARGKAADLRFLERVFTEAERALIRAAGEPDRVLWSLWAAKEAAYKAGEKLKPGLVFAHRLFAVSPGRSFRAGTVAHPDFRLFVRWENSRSWVHAVAFLKRPSHLSSPRLSGVEEARRWCRHCAEGGLSRDELRSAATAPSVAARALAKRLLAGAGAGALELVRPALREGLAPPVLLRDGRELPGWDVSLSHDGRFVSAAILPAGS